MPRDFIRCVEGGGRVRTTKPKGKKSKKYMPICYDESGSHVGEVKTRKARSRKGKKK